jgi:1-deoxy-D-xylulose-5-phosphate synthase
MILERVNSPADVKALSIPELTTLSREIRELIIETVSNTGGHLSSNLGVVELTLALHSIFDSPADRLIWDVGHQCYAHKIVTGRKDRFSTLRQDDGLSGFPSRQESPHDIFNTGHASNAISIAVGVAEANRKLGNTNKTIAIVGDGSLTGGMSFEALNHAGHLKSDIIVVLNDNEMSISKNIGALSSYLSRIMTGEFVSNVREELKSILKGLPALGDRVYKTARRLEEAVKGVITPGMLFEELGFQYVGPVDGHNLNHLMENLRNIKRLKGPILIHVVTVKGMGYSHAENDPAFYHGVPTFDLETGAPENHGVSYTDVFGDTIVDLARQDGKIVAVTAAMGLGTGLDRFSSLFPDRFYDIGIAEQHGVTFAAALALAGMRPFVAIYSTFLQRAYDQLLLDVCLQELPVVFAVDRSGIVGQDGPTHNGAFDLTYFRHMPNMILMAPKDENELRHMLYSAYRYGRTAAIRYPRGKAQGVALEDSFREIPLGTWEILRDGPDVTVVACGNTVYPALLAASDLEGRGIHSTVVNGRFVKPMDLELLRTTATATGRVVTVEENSLIGGFGTGVMEALADLGLSLPVRRLGIPDAFLPHGSQPLLRRTIGLDRQGIARSIEEWLRNG